MIGELLYKKRTFGIRDHKFPILSVYLVDNDEYVGWLGPSQPIIEDPRYGITTNMMDVGISSIKLDAGRKSKEYKTFNKALRKLCDMILKDEKEERKYIEFRKKREQKRKKIIETIDNFRRKYKNE